MTFQILLRLFAQPANAFSLPDRRGLLLLLLGWCLGLFSAMAPSLAAEQETDETRPPNILFIFSDDHAVQAIGAYGSQVNETPHIDRLAREGMIFDRSYCANSLCGPSRACILTGKHSHINGFRRNGDRFDGSQMTFPKLLQKTGYQTAVIGKWHLVTNPTGFDHWEILPGQGHYYNPDFIQMDGSRKRYEGYCTDLITDFSIEWLENQRDPNKPFVLMSQHKAPHRNWAPHPRHFGKYKLGTIPEPETLMDDYSGRTSLLAESEMSIRDHFFWAHDMKFHGENQYPEHFASGLPDGEYRRMTPEQRETWDAYYEPENQSFLEKMKAGELSDDDILRWKYQRYMHDYLGSVAAVDDSIGRLLDYLDESGLADNTIVIYASDQGFYLGEHGWYDKRWMFEESLRMPLVVKWPGVVSPGTRSGAMVQNIDYAPTFLEIAGVEIPADIQGRSLLPTLEADDGETPEGWRDAIYYAYYENDAVHMVPMHDGVRTERYKAMYFPRTREWNLFDLEKDPQEMTSLHDDPDYQDILAGLQQRYRNLRQYYDVNPATIPTTRGDEPRWKQRDRELTQRGKEEGHELVFLGDSITQGWEGAGQAVWEENYGSIKTLNLGIGGDRTEHLLWRLRQNQLGPNRPKAAVVMIGTNNTGHSRQDPRQVAEGVQKVLEVLAEKSPDTKVLLLGVFPRGASPWDPLRLNNVAINDYLRQLDDGKRVHYRDISGVFLEADGSLSPEIMPDYLHLSEGGYRRWAEAIRPILADWGVLP
jgi:arylsulfatase A-like enzyme/lysophospholipase L1-like esterase